MIWHDTVWHAASQVARDVDYRHKLGDVTVDIVASELPHSPVRLTAIGRYLTGYVEPADPFDLQEQRACIGAALRVAGDISLRAALLFTVAIKVEEIATQLANLSEPAGQRGVFLTRLLVIHLWAALDQPLPYEAERAMVAAVLTGA